MAGESFVKAWLKLVCKFKFILRMVHFRQVLQISYLLFYYLGEKNVTMFTISLKHLTINIGMF